MRAALVPAIVLALSSLSPGSAAAAGRKTRVAVLDVRGVGTVPQAEVQGLTTLLAKAVSAGDLEAISGEDIRAMVGFEKQKQLLGCAEASCLAEIGGALGVDLVVATEVAEVGGTWLLSLSMVSIVQARSAGRITRQLAFKEQLADAAAAGVQELLALSRRRAEAPPPARPPLKVAVLDLKATGLPEPKAVEGLSSLIASEVASREGLQVTSGNDIRAVIGFEKQRELLGCTDQTSCLAEIGGALGVDYLITSEVSMVTGTYLFSLSMVNIRKAKAAGRVVHKVEKLGNLVEHAISGVKELLFELGDVAGGTAAAGAPPTVQASSGSGNAAGWVTVGGGVLLVAGGGLLEMLAQSVRTEFDESAAAGKQTVTFAEAEAAELKDKLGLGLVGVGVGVIAVGSYLLLSDDEPARTASIFVAPTGDGVAAALSLPLP